MSKMSIHAGVLACISVVCVLGIAGCVSDGSVAIQAPPVPYSRGECPTFFIHYLPYPGDARRVAQPIPDTPGWTDERMERDLRRMTECGLDGVVLRMDPAWLDDAFRSSRVQRFVQLAAKPAYEGMQVALMLQVDGGGSVPVSYADLASWVTRMRFRSMAGVWRPGGRVAVIAGEKAVISGRPHPAVMVVRTGPQGGWHADLPSDASRLVPSPRFAQVLVYAGWKGDARVSEADEDENWALPRREGRTLRAELWAAFANQAQLICISSWNDFEAGDFVERNSLDGSTVYTALRGEIARVRQACSATAAAPADRSAP